MIRDRISEETKQAMKSGDKARLSTLRMVSSAIKNVDIEARAQGKGAAPDDQLLGVLQASNTYRISAWVRLANSNAQPVRLTLQQTDGAGTAYLSVATGTASTNNWTQLVGGVTLSDKTYLRPRLTQCVNRPPVVTSCP